MLEHDELGVSTPVDEARDDASPEQLGTHRYVAPDSAAHPSQRLVEAGLSVVDQLVEGDADLPGAGRSPDEGRDDVHQLDAEVQPLRCVRHEGDRAVEQSPLMANAHDDRSLCVDVAHRTSPLALALARARRLR